MSRNICHGTLKLYSTFMLKSGKMCRRALVLEGINPTLHEGMNEVTSFPGSHLSIQTGFGKHQVFSCCFIAIFQNPPGLSFPLTFAFLRGIHYCHKRFLYDIRDPSVLHDPSIFATELIPKANGFEPVDTSRDSTSLKLNSAYHFSSSSNYVSLILTRHVGKMSTTPTATSRPSTRYSW